MRIVLFSDIHANLPALEAFFKHIENLPYDSIYCLGDLVGYNIWPNEVIDEIRKRKIPTITGNYDYGIGKGIDDCGCAYKSDREKENGAVSIRFTNEIIKDEQRHYLRDLPRHIRLEFQLNDLRLNLLLVHGSPRKVNEYLFEDRPEDSLLRIMTEANADILCFGHTHKPYHRKLSAKGINGPAYRHAINIGSIGKPKDGDPRGGYVLLEIDEQSIGNNGDFLRVSFHRFEYDVERAATAIEESVLPDDYALSLRNGV